MNLIKILFLFAIGGFALWMQNIVAETPSNLVPVVDTVHPTPRGPILIPASASRPSIVSPTNRTLVPNPVPEPALPPSEFLAKEFASLIQGIIPDKYERKKGWGKTKKIQVGFSTHSNGLIPRIRKKEKAVNHGVWKRYRVTQIEPEKNLSIQIKNLRTVSPGRIGLTLLMDSKIHGWAQAKVYNRGIHVIALTTECDTIVQLQIDCEVGIKLTASSLLFGIEVDPVVTDSRLQLKDFRLKRVGEMKGPVIKELSSSLRHVIEDVLKPSKLTKKLNRSIDKKRDRLKFSPDKFFDTDWASFASEEVKKHRPKEKK